MTENLLTGPNKSAVLTQLTHELLGKKHTDEYIIIELEETAKFLGKWQGLARENRITRYKALINHAKSVRKTSGKI